ncbi:Deaminated glutathione amidase, chloroplastic/cytosolic, partial [Stylosanthes scabra]|nr:Deaminated glutathione amidase, chloroplastic/cytosolic [Stylosanthes scabra]
RIKRINSIRLLVIVIQIIFPSAVDASGKDVVAVDSPIGRLALTVCHDLRFPEIYQSLRFQHGAQVLLVPSAFTKVTGEAHWETLLRARAIENQCYVIAAAQAGKHNDKRESYGDTLIIDPWGTVIGRLPDGLSTGIVVADIDLSLVDSVREKMPIAKQRKPIEFWKAPSL